MATEKVASGVAGSAGSVGNGKAPRPKRLSREERNLPTLTANQSQIVKMIQNAENACKFLKQSADRAEPISKESLAACSVLSTALANLLGA